MATLWPLFDHLLLCGVSSRAGGRTDGAVGRGELGRWAVGASRSSALSLSIMMMIIIVIIIIIIIIIMI